MFCCNEKATQSDRTDIIATALLLHLIQFKTFLEVNFKSDTEIWKGAVYRPWRKKFLFSSVSFIALPYVFIGIILEHWSFWPYNGVEVKFD